MSPSFTTAINNLQEITMQVDILKYLAKMNNITIMNIEFNLQTIIKNQLMKASCYRKPRTAMPSKKNSNASMLYKDIGQTLARQYHQNKNHKKMKSKDYSCMQPSTQNSKGKSRKNSKQDNKQMNSAMYGINSRNYKNNIHAQLQNSIQNGHNQRKLSPVNNEQKPIQYNNYIKNEDTQKISTNVSHSKLNKRQGVLKNMNINAKVSDLAVMTPKESKTSKKNFDYKYIIGKGGFGKVWKVQHKKNRNQYAMKQMLKSLVMTKKSVQSVMNEKVLLSGLNSPFIVNMHYAFQDRDTLYLVLDLLQGGDLRHHLSTKTFSEIQAKFFICCIVLGLQYLHNNHIIHRDIKPQNLVLDSRGYIRITDLGVARIKKTNNSSDTSGTPGYMSPEVMCKFNHSYVSDYFALGVIAYELACQRRPYNGFSRNQVRQKMLAKQVQIRKSQLPEDWSLDAVDFINRLIMRKPQQRLGFNGIQQIKQHPWIKDLSWRKLATKQIQSPFLPLMRKSDFDQDEQITIQDQAQAELIQKNSLLLRKTQFQELFKQYTFQPTHRKSSKTISNKFSQRPSKQGIQNHPATISGVNSKLSLKTPHSSTRRMGNSAKLYQNSVRNSKQTILNGCDITSSVQPHHNPIKNTRHSHYQRPFFKV